MRYLGSKTLETERLVLKAQTWEEQHYLWNLLMMDEVNKYCLAMPKKYAEALKDWKLQEPEFKEAITYAHDLDVFYWSVFIKETNKCIGRLDCHPIKGEANEIMNVGWFIDPKYWRQGYGFEAAQAMLGYMFEECLISEIRTYAAIQNEASWRLMEKLGFARLPQTKMVEYTYLDEPVQAYQYYLSNQMYFDNKNNAHKIGNL